MAVPKSKTSKQRKNKRRASSYRLNKATIVECPNCHETKLPHRVCPSCGYYAGKEVIAKSEEI
ncbi:50S ribosomal protein L32 [Aedoeadaptatus coxii]|uniref:50S ribosomal protein L32 n=1 Tax=Aedoeadaptatus coxii TaxID=755172 RepID=UPI000837C6CF|nr:50S ribosomal protein L32 [Peptoniphilus coxii]CAC9930097.1 50S ribosomal protein L32 [Peptoniphilus coxii]